MSWPPTEETGRVRVSQEARWRKIKAAFPGAELEQELSGMGRSTRGRLAPDADWTPWRLSRGTVLRELEEQAAAR